MSFTVKQRGEFIATYRAIEVTLMETLAEWVPTTPEMEIKLLFGAHIWDTAQHADALGKRTYELRLPLQHSMPPAPEYAAILRDLRSIGHSHGRLAAFYDVILPALQNRYRNYLSETDSLMDAPSVRILERILEDKKRMMEDCGKLRRQLKLETCDIETIKKLEKKESSVQNVVAPRPAA